MSPLRKFHPPTLRLRSARVGALALALTASSAAGLAMVQPAGAGTTGATQTYVVLYKSGASTSGAATAVRSAGGTVVANYSQIGVVIARSGQTSFASAVQKATKAEGVSATTNFGVGLGGEEASGTSGVTADAPAPGSDGEPLAGWQWDMEQINAFAAHQITGGDSDVIVGDLDTGLDFTHPDLAPNYRADLSADCSSGAPAPLQVGNDQNGHGTHTAGTIAAAVNDIGVTGVAPNVGLAGVKSSNDDGFFFPEMVVCAYMWVAAKGIDVTNNSYFADPWLYNCVNDPTQRTIWKAERRAIQYAQSKGTVVVSSEGNDSDDLSHATQDVTSPDNTTPVTREISNACSVIPVEVPGVIGVTATGDLSLKSYYSSYGISTADVAAPGGDRRFQVTADPGGGRVLSTWPANAGCAIQTFDQGAKYCWIQGTSMAGPHVAGLAALVLSQGVAPQAVESVIESSSNGLPCPDTSQPIYANFPGVNSGAPQTCTGGIGHNSFYGAGEVDALAAVN
jgi:lantibiotic leader peptide-processing serine protease